MRVLLCLLIFISFVVCGCNKDHEPRTYMCGDFGGRCHREDSCQEGLCCLNDKCSTPISIISDGSFMMGCNILTNENCADDEYPYHNVNVPKFGIDVTEVTVGQYRVCVEDSGSCSTPAVGSNYCNWNYSNRENHPVNCIYWNQAKEYCEWSGKRLCSESEWEKAARGTDGRIFPWGNENATCELAVIFTDGETECNVEGTLAIGSKPAGIYGLYDMAGNVTEWVEDDYHLNYEGAPDDGSAWVDNPRRSEPGCHRGGNFDSWPAHVRSSNRYGGSGAEMGFGVRCCRTLP